MIDGHHGITAAKRVLLDVARVQSMPHILFLYDDQANLAVRESFEGAFSELGLDVERACIPALQYSHASPSESVVRAMQRADLMITHLTQSITHALATRQALAENGLRLLVMKGITLSEFLSAVDIDYGTLRHAARAIASHLHDGAALECAGRNGTVLSGRVAMKDAPFLEVGDLSQPGSIAVIPSGLISWSLRNTVGTLALDALEFWGALSPPMILNVEAGYVRDIPTRTPIAEQLRDIFSHDPDAAFIGEIGLGLNRRARWRGSQVTGEAKRAAGLCHVGLGNSVPFGGSVWSKHHFDGLIPGCTMWIDGVPIVDDGQLCADNV